MSPSFSPYLLHFHSISLHSSLILVISTASLLMRHRCSSMHRNALSSDLDTAERWPDLPLVWQRVTQPQPHHTTLLPSFKQPCALATSSDLSQTQQEYQAWVIRRIPSESGCSGALIPLNHTKTVQGCLKPLKMCTGISDSHKHCPQWGLVLPDRPCHVGQCPTSRVELQGPGVGTYRLGNSAQSAGRSAPKIGRQVD